MFRRDERKGEKTNEKRKKVDRDQIPDA